MMTEFGDAVRWLGVYIAEAHALDEWPMPCLNSPCRHTQPTCNEERAAHAREFLEDLHPPFDVLVDPYVDGWTDSFLSTFGAWPERFYVFQENTRSGWHLRWWNTPTPLDGHRIDDVREWLETNVNPLSQPPLLRRTTSEQLREETRLAKVRDVFLAQDADGKGFISRDQVRQLIESLGYMKDPLDRVFAEMDVDRSGTINLQEFEAFYSSIHPRLQEELRAQAQLQHVGPTKPQSTDNPALAA